MLKQLIRHWIPAAFCAFVVYTSEKKSDRVSASQYILIWMPMCFFFAAMVSYSMQKQIQALQAEVEALRSAAAGAQHGD